MGIYFYTGRDASGKRRKGWIEADTPKAARIALRAEGVYAGALRPASAGRLAPSSRARFYNEAGALVSAGFTLEQALGFLLGEGPSRQRAAFLLSLRDSIRDGAPLSRAMASLSPGLPAFERTALETAEEAGLQGRMLVRLAGFIESEGDVADRIRAALGYPVAVLVLATAMLSLMVYVVLPRAAGVFSRFGDALPASAKLLAVWGPRLMTAFLATAVACGLVVWRLVRKARADAESAVRLERFALALPVARRALPLLWSQRFAGTMALLLGAGVTPQAAISAAGAATGSLWLARLSAKAAEDVRDGVPLSRAIASIGPAAPHLAEWIGVGERAGNLREMLEQAADRCRHAYETRLSRFLGLLEPALIVAVGGVVLTVAATVLRPMLQLAKSAAGM